MRNIFKFTLIFLLTWLAISIFILPKDVIALQKKTLVFDSQSRTEYKWNLPELQPKMPSDWSDFRFLVLEMKASSPQRFLLRLHTPRGVTSTYIHPFQNSWIRAAIPLEIFSNQPKRGNDMASLLNNQRAGYFMFNWGPYLQLNQIDSISIAMPEAIGQPALQIRTMQLTKEFPGDAVLEKQPLVDKFGQWIRDNWSGKISNLSELQAIWRTEEKELKPGNFDYCQYGGYCATKVKPTGFFRVELIEGKWWFVDPEGHLFFSAGVNVITPTVTTPITNRESLFESMPPENTQTVRVQREQAVTSFYQWNIWRRFGENWQKDWVDLTVRRMQAWGINTIANWSTKLVTDTQRMPYVLPITGWETKQTYLKFPDVYSPEFLQNSESVAAKEPGIRKNDPFLLGYFIGNEPIWPRRELDIINLILSGPDTSIRRELQKFLAQGDTPERRKEFFYRAYEKYLQVVTSAIRKYDPNHLILGFRFAGYAPDEMVKAGRFFDVFTLNKYEYSLKKQEMQKYANLSGRPLLIGEFHFGTPGRGMSAGLKQVRDQKQRGVAYRYYVENAAAIPEVIGTHWFQWVDEPSTGRFDGENYNIGLVDVTDRPYPELINAMKETHRKLYAIHAGKEKAIDQKSITN